MNRLIPLLAATLVFSSAAAHPKQSERPGTAGTFAGTGIAGYSGDGGKAAAAKLNQPFGVCFGPHGEMYIADCGNHAIRKVDPSGLISTVAGTGAQGYTGDEGPAIKATLHEPYAVVCDSDGNLFIADRLNACVRYVNTKSGKIFTLAGTGTAGYSGDGGIATRAQLKEPNGLALDGKGMLYIADVSDNRIRRVDLRSGTIITVAGTGRQEDAGDGDTATQASLNGARAVAVSGDGNLYVCERSGNRIREIDHRIGIIRTVCGTGKSGYTGDGRASILAQFNGPKWVESDARGTLFIADTENHCVRRVDADTGVVTTLIGDGKPGSEGDGGPGPKARLKRPHGCCVHNGIVYVADSENNRVRTVSLK